MISCTVLSDCLLLSLLHILSQCLCACLSVFLCVCDRNDHTRRVQCHISIFFSHLPPTILSACLCASRFSTIFVLLFKEQLSWLGVLDRHCQLHWRLDGCRYWSQSICLCCRWCCLSSGIVVVPSCNSYFSVALMRHESTRKRRHFTSRLMSPSNCIYQINLGALDWLLLSPHCCMPFLLRNGTNCQ